MNEVSWPRPIFGDIIISSCTILVVDDVVVILVGMLTMTIIILVVYRAVMEARCLNFDQSLPFNTAVQVQIYKF